MLAHLLFPTVPGLSVEHLCHDDQGVHLALRMTRRTARCPLCRRRSRRVHSTYRRVIADLPCGGRRLLLHVRLRRFRCPVAHCARRIFMERVPALVAPYARRTGRLQESLRRHGFDLGGAPGARHCTAEGMPVSGRTLLRLVRAAPAPVAGAVRVLGVDDWRRRKGRTYGTLLVNLETHTPLDLLPDRTAETFAAWLAGHPEVEIISRDRGGAYADGARQGAPQAQQTADRWHLLANLSDAVERLCRRQHGALRVAAQALVSTPAEHAGPGTAPLGARDDEEIRPSPPVSSATERDSQARRHQREARFADVKTLHEQGVSLSEIARRVDLDRTTVRRYVRAEACPQRTRRLPVSPTLAPYDTYLRERWSAGCQTADQLYQEIHAQGFRGGARTVRRYVALWRTQPARTGRAAHAPGSPCAAPPPPLRVFSPRQTTTLFFRTPQERDAAETAFLQQLTEQCPDIAQAHSFVQRFHGLVRTRDQAGLEPWLTAVEASGLEEIISFAQGLRRDRAAVDAALSLEWSNGQLEGQITRVKLLKRSMYGRSGFDLLRQRVLHRG